MKILVVDDSKAMRSLVIQKLTQAGFTGHTIQEATNGLEALNMIKADEPDLILSDWNMPTMTGIQLLEELNVLTNAGKTAKKIPFVFITSESTDSILTNARYNGALLLIPKPFTPKDFEDKLGGIIK